MGQQASSIGNQPLLDDGACSCLVSGAFKQDFEQGDAPASARRRAHSGGRATSSALLFPRSRVFRPHTRSRLSDHYVQEKLIGQGSHGKVFKAVTNDEGHSEADSWFTPRGVAIKCFVMEPMRGIERSKRCLENRALTKQSFDRERETLSQLEHPHIIKMYECFEERDYLWIVMEVCHGGELYEYIANHVRQGHGGVGEEQGLIFFKQMLHATSYMHAKQLVHRDLKTENYLLLGAPGTLESSVVKMCDFGSAFRLSKLQPRAMDVIGTLSYTAPEVYAHKGATVCADNWSLGACLYVLLVGASPFRITGQEPSKETISRIREGDFFKCRSQWTKLSKHAQDLVQRMLVVDERKRLTCAEALEHPWVSGVAPKPEPASAARQKPSAIDEAELKEFKQFAPALFQHLAHLASLDIVQRIVLNVCALLTPEAEVINCGMPVPWYHFFFVFDRDLDGCLSTKELLGCLKQLAGHNSKYTEEDLMRFIQAADVDGSGSIEWVEWVAISLLSSEGVLSEMEPLRTAFRLLDRPSGDGRIGAADLLALLEPVGAGVVSSLDGREQANRLIRRWASLGPDSPAQAGSNAEVCLRAADLKNLLEDAYVEPGPELTEDLSDWKRGLAGKLFCCRADPCQGSEGPFGECNGMPPLLREPTFGTDMSEHLEERSSFSPER